MISCRLQGGLGNQIFQIAAATSLARELDTEAVFDFDACFTGGQGHLSSRYKNTIFKYVRSKDLSDYEFGSNHDEPKFSYSEIPRQNHLLLSGYFQSEKYFVNHKDHIVALFHLDEKRLEKTRKYLNKITQGRVPVTAVHIRRGDYLDREDYHPVLTLDYYRNAMSLIGHGHFMCVSDDLNWCKENFKGQNIHYSPFEDELDDLALIAASDHQIVANSSFSWWGAYLCPSKNNRVIAPEAWFGPKGPQDIDDLIPSDWMKI